MKQEFKEFRTKYFYNNYPDNNKCDRKKFAFIISTFFEFVVDEILSGVSVKLPYLGIFKTIQKPATKKSIDFHQTKINKAKGIEDYIVYRDNPYYYAFKWDRNLTANALKYHAKSLFYFNPTSTNNRKIPEYHDILELVHS